MLQPAPRAWLPAEWQISWRMCVRLVEWEQECFGVYMPIFPFLIPVCILPQCSLCFIITHSQAACSPHFPLTHSWTHPLHSTPAVKGTLSVFLPSPWGHIHTMCHLTHSPYTKDQTSLSPFPTLVHSLKNTLLNLPGNVGSHAAFWSIQVAKCLCHLNCESGNICCKITTHSFSQNSETVSFSVWKHLTSVPPPASTVWMCVPPCADS